MKLIIDVNENYYKKLKTELKNSPDYPNLDYCQIIIASGTPVSNEGDLISRSELKKAILEHCRSEIEAINHFWYDDTIISLIDNAPTIEIPNYGGQVVPDTLQGWKYEERQQGEWIDYDNTFYKCPDCGYLLEKCCPQCQNKVILPKGGAE